MEFAILGPLRVSGPDGAIEIGAPKQRALLAMLLLSYRDDAVSSGRLIDVLWDEDPPPTANKALQVHVSQLRRALRPQNPIVTRPAGYAIELAPGPLAAEPAVALFLRRARAVDPRLALGNGDEPLIARICDRLDGLPLAIELAAARIKVLSPGEILDRLSRRLDLLSSGPRDAPVRQQTLRAAIGWSYDLLDGEAKRLFSELG